MRLDFGVEIARIKCWKHGEHGEQKMLRVVESSGTPRFVVMGQRIGIKKTFESIRKFGFESGTEID